MARVLIIHSNSRKLKTISEGLAEGARNQGNEVDILSTEENKRSINFHSYKLVLIGSPTRGIFRGKIAKDIPPYLKKCKQTIGQIVIAFVTPRLFATTKALRKLMNQIEKQGCFVKDFTSLKNKKEAVEFGKNINKFIE